jgi:transposase-like protein
VYLKTSRVGTVTKGDAKSLAVKNLAKQVGEVYTAATKGKSGTKSAKMTSLKKNRSHY